MPRIEFPGPLKQLLEESDLQAPIRSLADRTGEILADNKLPFFPDYTDHGTDHANCVLKSEVDLVPKSVWANSKQESDPRVLCDADAAVIIGATLLHDIAMHLRPDGFRELVSKDSRFRPLPWFGESHEGPPADRSWHDLWEDYVREARRFSDRDLASLIGEESAGVWKFHNLPEDAGQWETNHRLIVGEFIRRHHARLAHEVAIYGYPGLSVGSGEGQFPSMGEEEGHPLMRLADLIGLTARSHGISLRACQSYLESSPRYLGAPRPMGTAVLYPMALLRVADYLQIDRQRAPAVLLQLRNPQSPISVQEWSKHRAVQHIGPATDPRGTMVTVSTDLSLALYLQLRDLLAGVQAEMDHAAAVLDEIYGNLRDLGLDQLNLATRRVHSNLQSPAFRDNLPYVPDRTGFTADPNLLTLLVEPLYGKQPGVGVRELIQNAVDAVRELEAWCKARGVAAESLDLPEQDGDVLVEFTKRENGTWFLRVRDRGIGMRSDTLQNYFLRAGAAFRRSPEWAKEFLDEKGQPRVVRAGRFGIGAFAVFLLGPSFRLRTRHAGVDKSMGYTIEASANSQLIEIGRVGGLPVGTTIEVEVSAESVEALGLENKVYSGYEGPGRQIDWFCWDWPKVIIRVVRGPTSNLLHQQYSAPIRSSRLPPAWSVIHPEGFDAVYWTFGDSPRLACNGLQVRDPGTYIVPDIAIGWPEETQLKPPCVAVLDSAANLPLTIQRYALAQRAAPFIDDLARDVTLSFIAHMLVCGPMSRAEALSLRSGHPLRLGPFSEYGEQPDPHQGPFSMGRLRCCMTSTAMVPADPWLYTLLNAESCLVYGTLSLDDDASHEPLSAIEILAEWTETTGHVILPWHGIMDASGDDREENLEMLAGAPAYILWKLAREGVAALGHEVEASHVLVSPDPEFYFDTPTGSRRGLHSRHMGPEPGIWWEVFSPDSRRPWFEARTGTLTPSLPLDAVLEAIAAALPDDNEAARRWRGEPNLHVLFVSEIRTRPVERAPESLIARIWNKCLGARPIPFDLAAREAMIADGCRHRELERHIKAWQEMQRSGSKWVGGD